MLNRLKNKPLFINNTLLIINNIHTPRGLLSVDCRLNQPTLVEAYEQFWIFLNKFLNKTTCQVSTNNHTRTSFLVERQNKLVYVRLQKIISLSRCKMLDIAPSCLVTPINMEIVRKIFARRYRQNIVILVFCLFRYIH